MATSGKHSWIESSDVFSLFPTLAWKIQLRAEVHEPIDAGKRRSQVATGIFAEEVRVGELGDADHQEKQKHRDEGELHEVLAGRRLQQASGPLSRGMGHHHLKRPSATSRVPTKIGTA